MKKSLIILTVLLNLFAGVAIASSNSGSAIIPHYVASRTVDQKSMLYTWFFVSNITDQDINVEVTFYRNDGSIVHDTDNDPKGGTLRAYSVSNYKQHLSDTSLSFTIGPNSSGQFEIVSYEHWEYSKMGGYGIIKWEQNSKAVQGLVAHALEFYEWDKVKSQTSVHINNGLPF